MKIVLTLIFLSVFITNAQQLLVHYNFNQNLNDDSGNNLNCTKRSGTPVYVNGASEINGAVQLNGNSSDVYLMPANSLLRPNYPFSVSITFKVDNFSPPLATVFSSVLGTDMYMGANIQVHQNGMLALSVGNGTNTTQSGRRTLWAPPGSILANVWYNVVAIVRSDSDMELWINCKRLTSSIDYGCNTVTNITQPYYNGCASVPVMMYGNSSLFGGMGEIDVQGSTYNATNTYWMDGAIDDMKFWSGEISEDLILQMNVVDASATQNGIVLSANSSSSQYQWINCVSNTPISGETNQSFAPSLNGSYAVIVTNSGSCSDTSDCFNITTLDLEDIHLNGLKIYPNPTNGNFRMIIPAQATYSEFVISDTKGRKVVGKAVGNAQFVDVEFDYPSGIYFITLIGTDGTGSTAKLIKN